MNKKGVSPLIATILLIAFAVSVGAVIMNWTSTSSGIQSDGQNDGCTNVNLKVIEYNNQKSICLDREEKKLIITLENGPSSVKGIRLSYVGFESNFIDFNEVIEAGVVKKINLNYDPAMYGELNSIKIIPFIIPEHQKMYCSNSGETLTQVSDCN